MKVRRFCAMLAVLLGLLFQAQSSTPPAQAQESTPEGLVFGCLADMGYDVLDVYGDQDAGMVVMGIVSYEWDELLRFQIVWGWHCLYPVYEDSERLATVLEYEARYLLVFLVDRADYGAWLSGEMSDTEFAAAYTYAVYDMQIGDWISETDFMHIYFPGAEPVIVEEESVPRVGRQPEEPAFSDDFSDELSGLTPEYADYRYDTAYVDGEYHISVLTEQLVAWSCYDDLEFDDFAVQVQARLAEGSSQGDYGLLIRVEPDTGEFYLFGINADGYYHVYKRAQGEWTALVGWWRSSSIHGDGEWDLLRIEASGPSMTFLVNGEPLVTVEDETFTTGTIGLYAENLQDSFIHAAFDNLIVWTEETPSGVVEEPPTGAPAIGPVTWYRSVGQDGEWQDPVTEYPSGTRMIIGVWDYENMEDGLTWGEVWSYEGDIVIDERDWYVWTGGQSGSESSSLSYRDGGPLPSGDYELRFYVEDELVRTASTKIR